MKKNKNKNVLQIPELNDRDVEKLAQDVPALSADALKRITESCINKMNPADASAEFSEQLRVSGTENYSRPRLIRYISATAACIAAIVSITGVMLISKNLGKIDDRLSEASIMEAQRSEAAAMEAQLSEAAAMEAQKSDAEIFALTKGTWHLTNGNTEIAFIAMDGEGGYTVYELNGNCLDSGKLNHIWIQADDSYQYRKDGIQFTFNNKLYELFLDTDFMLCSSDYLTPLYYTKESGSPHEPSAGSYFNRMTGIWVGSDSYKYKYITVERDGRYNLCDKTGTGIEQGYLTVTEIGVDPGDIDVFNTYSLDKEGVSFHFIGKDSIKSNNDEEYKRVSLEMGEFNDILNAQYNQSDSDYSGRYLYENDMMTSLTVSKNPNGSYTINFAYYENNDYSYIKTDSATVKDGFLNFTASDEKGNPVRCKMLLTEYGCSFETVSSSSPDFQGRLQISLEKTS